MEVKHRLLNFNEKFIYQNTNYFTFSLDSLLLANFVTINLSDKKIIDLATGNAPIPMLLTNRTKATIYGIELQKEIYNLGLKSILENKLEKQIIVINENVKQISNIFESDFFDIVTCNPPYFRINENNNVNDNKIKSIARHEIELNLEDVLKATKKILKNGGTFAMVHRPERLVEIIEIMKKYNIEPKRIRFVYPKENRNANILLIEGIKNGKPGLKILNPLIVYNQNNEYTSEIRKMFGE